MHARYIISIPTPTNVIPTTNVIISFALLTTLINNIPIEPINNAIKKAFLACNDIILFKYDNDIGVIDKIIKLAKKEKIQMKRINKSVMRILKVKEQYDLKDEIIEKDKNFIKNINKQIEEINKKF